jgi:hypothetical protein
MLSCRNHLAALAAVTAALAVAVPSASASAATTTAPSVDPQVCQLMNPNTMGLFGPIQLIGGASLTNTLAHAAAMVNCPSPAP